MATTRLTGPNRIVSPSRRTAPSVRFRQDLTRQRQEPVKTRAAKGRGFSLIEALGPLTPIGFAALAGTGALLAILAWVFLLGQTFLVRNVEIASGTTLSQSDIQKAFYTLEDKRLAFFVPGNNIFFINKAAVSESLTEKYAFVAGIADFKKDWPNKISFKIVEKNPAFIWQADDGRKFLLDGTGSLLGQYNGVENPPGMAILQSRGNAVPRLGEKLAGSQLLDRVVEAQNHWPAEWSFKPISYTITSDQADGELNIITSEGWLIKTSGQIPGQLLVNNLRVIFANEIKEDTKRAQLAYVDLRLPNRAFYCLKGQQCAAR